MTPFDPKSLLATRRSLLVGGLAFATTLFTVKGAYAAELAKTPRLTEGPFYPDKLPLDTDNDLIIIKDSITPASGEITHLFGRILDESGAPVKDATMEIWQVDAGGAYLHSGTGNKAKQDKHFQGFGTFTTGEKGEYRFRTIKPIPYPGRTPHIHFKVKIKGREVLCSQIFVSGHAQNANDGVLRDAGGLFERELVMADFKAKKDSKIGELEAKFDVIIGKTPDERPRDER